ncbi:hypothetical protein BDP55DRAFT_203796 [Colletotrichum godetiae]|uniref:Uncharacterized protein n=1 Tax=Colletotrichum godetiae TaxID=1209918 RepID=A0AAJ0AWR0_9PEZI|nr:uncharacterized protein BDP55DRAFT_203796 [Colletotrichum godetiae]KAK1699700.1 hypothetical protein BDP55DRAFT_203796 [Colletotrichum godetiae]
MLPSSLPSQSGAKDFQGSQSPKSVCESALNLGTGIRYPRTKQSPKKPREIIAVRIRQSAARHHWGERETNGRHSRNQFNSPLSEFPQRLKPCQVNRGVIDPANDGRNMEPARAGRCARLVQQHPLESGLSPSAPCGGVLRTCHSQPHLLFFNVPAFYGAAWQPCESLDGKLHVCDKTIPSASPPRLAIVTGLFGSCGWVYVA